MKDIITPPFTEEQKELIIMTEKLASSRKICDVDDIDDDIKDINEIILETIAKIENQKQTNFDRITESPEKLAEFIDKIICHCSDHDKDCTECPMRENRNCDYETTLEWLNQEGEE